MELVYILIAGLLVVATAFTGVLFVSRNANDWLQRRLSYLVAFSAGVFLVTAGSLSLEVFELFKDNLALGVILILAGYLAGFLLEYLLPESHHHHEPGDHSHHHGTGSAKRVVIGDAVHNVSDGIMLVPAFLASPALGLAVSVSILVHETLQELSEYFVLRQAGYSAKRALIVNGLTALTIFIGIGISLAAVATLALEGLLLALSAGFFLHIVIHDVWPRRSAHESWGQFGIHIVILATGLFMMALLSVTLAGPHVHGGQGSALEHTHESDHEHEHHY